MVKKHEAVITASTGSTAYSKITVVIQALTSSTMGRQAGLVWKVVVVPSTVVGCLVVEVTPLENMRLALATILNMLAMDLVCLERLEICTESAALGLSLILGPMMLM